MMQQTAFGAETSRWPETRQNWAITTPPGPGAQFVTPSAPPSGWPALSSTCLPGLESLMHLDKVFIDQHIDLLEAVTGWPVKNRYIILDEAGRPMFYLNENSSLLSRLCCGSSRGFEIKIFDRSNREVLRLRRKTDWCLTHLKVYAGETYLGKVREKFSFFCPELDILDESGNPLFQITGSCCYWRCCASQNYKVYSADASRQVGVISKTWSGMVREMFTNSDIFGVSFPTSIDVKHKTLLLAAAILIDFIYHEEEN